MGFRHSAQLLVLGTCAALVLPLQAARSTEESVWQDAVDRLALEKILAEGCISLLKTAADRDPMQRVQVQRIYARASADVDGLIALLQADLAGDRPPAAIPELRYRLESVPRQRQGLCEYVDAAAESAVRGAEGSAAVGRVTEGVAGTATSPVEAAVEIWEVYRRAGDAERARIITAIEATRWREYGEISPGASR